MTNEQIHLPHLLMSLSFTPSDNRIPDALELAAKELMSAHARIAELKAENKKWRNWTDAAKDQYSDKIAAAHPMQTNNHDRYGVALKMVNSRQDKFALVNLVNWLLSEALPASPETGDK